MLVSLIDQQLVPLLKSHSSGLARFLFWDDQLARLYMVILELHVFVGGACFVPPKKLKRSPLIQGRPQLLLWFDLLEEKIEFLMKLSQFFCVKNLTSP